MKRLLIRWFVGWTDSWNQEMHREIEHRCSFAGRIAPLRLPLPPGPRERRDPVVRPLESQFLQFLMDLFQRAPLLA